MSKAPQWQVTLSDLDCTQDEEQAVLDVLRGGWLSMGPGVAAFETAFAERHGARHAVAVNSGTAALHLALLSNGIGPGDEVIQPAINFVAAANMTRAVGATPRFVDIVSAQRPLIDPAAVERAVSPRTKALIVLHYGGYPADIVRLQAIAKNHDLILIEDACHAPDTAVDGRYLGTWGAAGCFSFFPNKNMTTAEGGMILTNCDDVEKRCRNLRSHGMTTVTWQRHRGHASSYDVLEPGFNYRLDELRAALGRVQLDRLGGFQDARRRLTRGYREQFAGHPDVEVVLGDHDGAHAGHLFVILVPEARRPGVVQACKERGIQTSMHYPCATTFSGHHCDDVVPHSLDFARRAVTLPLHPGLSPTDIEQVCDAVRAGLPEAQSVGR